MIVIQNHFDETYIIETRIDPAAPGCRVKASPPEPLELPPGMKHCIIGYEPGTSFIIRPAVDSDKPRSIFGS